MRHRSALVIGVLAFAVLAFVDTAGAYYMPRIGRFISRDPIAEPGSIVFRQIAPSPADPLFRSAASRFVPRDAIAQSGEPNRYAYVANKATNWVDPLGLDEMPSLQCKDSGSPVTWSFDGAKLEGWEAVSGLPVKETETKHKLWDETLIIYVDLLFDYTTARQQVKDAGPIPQGSYWFDVCKGRNIRSSPWSHGVKRGAWGAHSWSLHPPAGTNTYGRSGFFIHGGQRWGSKGCIDVLNQDGVVADEIERIKKQNGCCCYITVNVNYPNPFVTKSELRYGGWVKRRMP